MSEFFRTHAPTEFVKLTTRDLARLAHQAEDTSNDVLLVQVWDELDRRERTCPHLRVTDLFRTHYIDLHRAGFRPVTAPEGTR